MKNAASQLLSVILIIICLSLNISASSNQSGDYILKDVGDKISRAFSAYDVETIKLFTAEGNRIYSDWEEVFSSKGYFGKEQVILSLQKFFRSNEILAIQLPEDEKKQIGDSKFLFKMIITYKNKLKDSILNQNIFFMLVKQSEKGNTANPSGWIINEIKKMN